MARGRVQVRPHLWVQGLASSVGPAEVRPHDTPHAAPSLLWKCHGTFPISMLKNLEPVMGFKFVLFSDLGIGFP